ncbi:MAG TPA: LuxR C-terminal-related transcriptional regulator, partial [Longimicrobiales bacterium]|nr:LuxR C-terminal-related transcriptional regulator [Longimicrobiales bacterium]
ARAALEGAVASDDPGLKAKAHRSLALLHVWIGPPSLAESHAREAITLAAAADDPAVEFWARWGLAVLWGMIGDTTAMARSIQEARELAERIRSPVLRLWTSELSIELAYATGDWDSGIALGEQSIALARSLNQKTLLPRLMVWTSLFHVGRGDLERARALVDEACHISGMHEEGPHDVHLVVPAYTGLAHYLVALGEYTGAIKAARRGLEIAEGTGYTLWAVHRLLPILAEACLWAGEIEEAEALGRRMRAHSQEMNHRLGLAWSDACDALVRWKKGDSSGGAAAMSRAAAALEEIPMIPYAVRIRRQLAGRLAEIGDTEGAGRELKAVHEVLAQLGAEVELEKARVQFREVGHRPPPRGSGEGMAGLTARELEIARLVALRRSNKAIGKELGISPRTVSTHLSNIFQKLDLASRAELGDAVRDRGLLQT